ncbi:MAG: threonine synthase [Candidatus Deianiraeaceae bacterium]|jgi:threonine synthase
MFYNTTRDQSIQKTFAEIVLASNAPCGGLYIPTQLPNITTKDFQGMQYSEIAEKIISIFTEIPQNDIENIVEKSLINFTTHRVFEKKVLEPNLFVAELFHGPTLSFKDYPMQFLGNIIEYTLSQTGKKLNILTATSGDTGSAAIHAFAEKENIKIIVLHPKGKITEFQRKQMTTVHAKNVLNIAIDGTFDDCQNIVKEITNQQNSNISTVNSINWGRIMMQMVYYIKLLCDTKSPLNIFVPTGNFGNIFACYFLKKCGFDGIKKLYISNNANDTILNVHKNGIIANKKTIHTLSPAMDISIPSNFERMLYLEIQNDKEVKLMYNNIAQGEDVKIHQTLLNNIQKHFGVSSVTDTQTLETIRNIYTKYNYIIDPHTAVAFTHYFTEKPQADSMIISTAHPCKFEKAVQMSTKQTVLIPQNNSDITLKEEKLEFSDKATVNQLIADFFS